jgi:anti-sigma factor RsiW
MNCRGVSRRLSAYIDNDLSPGIRQGVEEHLQHCISCKRRLLEFEAILTAARNLAPLTASEGFQRRVIEAIHTRRETHEILSSMRYRLTLAGVAFMVTSAAIFFIIGPPSSSVVSSLAGSPNSSVIDSARTPDFASHPEIKVYSFPVPESSEAVQFSDQQNPVPVDSTRPNEFVLPNLQKVNQNVDGKF